MRTGSFDPSLIPLHDQAKNIFDKQAPPDAPKHIIIVADGVENEHPEKVGS